MVSPLIHMPNAEKHSGVSGIPTQLLVVHSGECPLRGGYAQSLTNWANIPLNQGGPQASWHWFADPIAIVSMVDPMLAAWHASEANPMSEGFEQAGYARFTREEWLTAEGRKSIDNLAWIMAQRMKANDIPHRWLTTDEVTAVTTHGNRSIKGLCLHRQIDPETRYDPGNNYPFDVLDERIAFHLGTASAPDSFKEFLMALTPEQQNDIYWQLCTEEGRNAMADRVAERVLTRELTWYGSNGQPQPEGSRQTIRLADLVSWSDAAWGQILSRLGESKALLEQVAEQSGTEIDYEKLAKAAVNANIDVAALAKAVNDEAAARLQD